MDLKQARQIFEEDDQLKFANYAARYWMDILRVLEALEKEKWFVPKKLRKAFDVLEIE